MGRELTRREATPASPDAQETTDNCRMTNGGRGFALHLEKVLHAPSERVYAACVEPESVAEWFGPKGFTAVRVDAQVREGGRYRLTMQPPEGKTFHIAGEFREVEPQRR